MELQEFREKYSDYIVSTRRALHKAPELSLQEKSTSALVIQEAKRLNLQVEMAGQYGVMAILEGGMKTSGSKTIALRADMDALPMNESERNLLREKSCCSEIPGKAHLCGHDCHVAMLLAVMRELCNIRNTIAGTVLFCFESGEEIGEGFKPMVPLLEKYGADCCYAVHVWPTVEAGKIAILSGPVMAAVGAFEYTIVGKGAHGACPHEGIDPILCACDIISQLNMLVARERSPIEPFSLTIGHIEGGSQRNIIPDSVSFGGTMRFFNRARGEELYGRMKEIVDLTARAHRCEAVHDFEYLSYPLVNDAETASVAIEAVKASMGSEYIGTVDIQTGSDGYVNYIRACKGAGVYAMLGIANAELGCGEGVHKPRFDVDENALIPGAYSTLQVALALLKKGH